MLVAVMQSSWGPDGGQAKGERSAVRMRHRWDPGSERGAFEPVPECGRPAAQALRTTDGSPSQASGSGGRARSPASLKQRAFRQRQTRAGRVSARGMRQWVNEQGVCERPLAAACTVAAIAHKAGDVKQPKWALGAGGGATHVGVPLAQAVVPIAVDNLLVAVLRGAALDAGRGLHAPGKLGGLLGQALQRGRHGCALSCRSP